MVRAFSEQKDLLTPESRVGCFVDTTILFSATYPLDPFNNECEDTFNFLADNQTGLFTNVNVRSEFLEHHRRVLIAECLIDLYEDEKANFVGILQEKLKSHRSSYRKKILEEKSAKIDLNQIKVFRNLLSNLHNASNGDGWDLFCSKYLHKKLEAIWPAVEDIHQVNFISNRTNDKNPFLRSIPQWGDTVSLMGRYGLGSSDAMILNMFLCSIIPTLLTADRELATCVVKESKGLKQVFMPDSTLKK